MQKKVIANDWMQKNYYMQYDSPLLSAGVVHAKCEPSPLIRPAAVKNTTKNKNTGGIFYSYPVNAFWYFSGEIFKSHL